MANEQIDLRKTCEILGITIDDLANLVAVAPFIKEDELMLAFVGGIASLAHQLFDVDELVEKIREKQKMVTELS